MPPPTGCDERSGSEGGRSGAVNAAVGHGPPGLGETVTGIAIVPKPLVVGR